MAAPTVYQDVAEGVELEGVGQLFAGKKFWVAQRVPSRNRLLDDIKANGGEIVLLEKKADYLIADHFRPRESPPGSLSYEFVEKSIQDGALRDPEHHRAGPPLGEVREVGSISRPSKGGRTPYTAEEDRILYKWVRDAETAGGLASGNEMYKQLEAKYPRHTWQSWRDHYLKVLRTRPPSAFNIPDNAPPSPPSDPSNDRVPPVATSTRPAPTPTEKTEQPQPGVEHGGLSQNNTKDEDSLNKLAASFTSEDWEELYAFVDIIHSLAGTERYDASWVQWAEHQEHHTPEQWRQYYEKVVRPQWLRDPVSKREQIRKKIERKHEGGDAVQSQAFSQQEHVEVDALERVEVSVSTTLEQNVVEVSSSTARPESPKVLTDILKEGMKRALGEEVEETPENQRESPRPAKRRKSASPTGRLEETPHFENTVGTQVQPLEISSAESTSSTSQVESVDQTLQDLTMEETIQNQLSTQVNDSQEALRESEIVAESTESDDLPDIDRLATLPEDDGQPLADGLPSNTPTPRATRRAKSNFDTQAILSSPSQELPLPLDLTQDLSGQMDADRSFSPVRIPDSDASTTQSLQEFRRSLNAEELAQISHPGIQSARRPASPSPAPSSASSTGSGDPDVPLEVEEFDDFFDEQHAEGFTDEFIVKALKRTRCRPGLAIQVLEAWRDGKPLPNQRGIWSMEEDEAVESGDGLALAMLQRKHSLDGWGGITERLIFLEAHRSR